jgi:hypothetical protein
LDKQNLEIISQIQEPPYPLTCFVYDIIEPFGSVANFGNGHAGTLIVNKLLSYFFQDREGQCGGTRIEIMNSFSHH